MRITTQGDYALRCVLNIAKNGKDGPVAISRMGDEENLSLDYIEQLLMKLRRHRIIKSVRGVNGGYLLTKKPHRINVKQVLMAVEGDAFEVICVKLKSAGSKKCKKMDDCSFKHIWFYLKRRNEQYLEKPTIQSLLRKDGVRK